MIRDAIGLSGFAMLLTGITVRYGWDVAAIIGGSILMALAIIGAIKQ